MMKSRYPAFPYILFMTIFIVVPLLIVVYFAFTTSDGSFTLQNIIRVKNYIPVTIKSLYLSFARVSFCVYYGKKNEQYKKNHVYAYYAADVDELFTSHICMDDNS